MRYEMSGIDRRISNTTAYLYVKSVPVATGEETMCPESTWVSHCTSPATHWYILGKHRSPACTDVDHVENTLLRVAQAFANEMMDLYGDVPE